MSHFTVLVIGDDIDGQLAPFQENNMGDCPEELLEFFDRTEEVMEDWENQKEDNPTEYGSIESFAEEYHGYKINEEGKFGYYENPKAKWDWYQIGGRWMGTLILKESKIDKARLGEPGAFGYKEHSTDEILRTDQALKGDIDWKRMNEVGRIEAGESYDCAMKEKESVRDIIYGVQTNETRGEYIERTAGCGFSTFAVVKDGKWYERGEMGWWGIIMDEKEKRDWNIEFFSLVADLPDETLLTIVDCHI
jgi:hypothetical protein